MNMMRFQRYWCCFLCLIVFAVLTSCDDEKKSGKTDGTLQLNAVRVGTYNLNLTDFSQNTSAPVDKPIIVAFSGILDQMSAEQSIVLTEISGGTEIPLTLSWLDNNKTVSAQPGEVLKPNSAYKIEITDDLNGKNDETFPGYAVEFTTIPSLLTITSITAEEKEILTTQRPMNLPLTDLRFTATFSHGLNPESVADAVFISGPSSISVSLSLENENKTLVIVPNQAMKELSKYQLVFTDNLRGSNGEILQQYAKNFYTTYSSTPDFPLVTDEALLTLVQEQTFKYFWDLSQPASGMARERNTSGDLITSGGSGFGLMALIVGMERSFITRSQGLQRLDKILNFLENADRFHGAWSHWINGNTGDVIPFSDNDNGGDLVETAFLIQGLLTFRQYLNDLDATEHTLINRINMLWQSVEWNWYTKGGEDVLYWHWSPDKEWIMNHKISGNNETMITYILAASSPTHAINASAYYQGYARNGAIVNGNSYYDITLPLGESYGGPLFFTHYSYLGLDPRNLEDKYANYWDQNVNHSRINHAHCVVNPKGFVGYSSESWGLTASDDHIGYSAHSPTNDIGVISPTAALSSFPYTPIESMKALKFFYYTLGDRLWGDYGFYDAYNLTEGWTANSYLAIDQGPIIVMIENYRTGLLWDLFMSAPEIQAGLSKLDFDY
jgi:hypothetical protein